MAGAPQGPGEEILVARGPRAPRQRNRIGRRIVDIRALLRDREFIKITTYLLPRASKLQVLELMERLRQARMPDGRAGDPAPLPEMTTDEIVREINWRVGTLPPDDAEEIARYVRRITQWRVERRRRAAEGPIPRPAAPADSRS